jgi:FixJ family two-component response regulator
MKDSKQVISEANMGKKTFSLIGIVDDDESVRESLSSLMRSVGYKTAIFSSSEAFLDSDRVSEPDCLVLDVRMPGLSGLELQGHLHDMKCPTPIIFVTAHADDQVRARALQQGATAVLGKPFSDEDLLGIIHSAIEVHEASATQIH